MTQQVRFKKLCAECGRVFFAAEKQGKICPGCGKKAQEREKARKKVEEKRKTPSVKPRPAAPAAAPAAPLQPLALTGELKTRILEAYELYRGRKDLPLKKVYAQIARKLQVRRQDVAQVLGHGLGRKELTGEEEKEIIARYRQQVERMERPVGGRRKTISRELGLPFRDVALTVRKWKAEQPPMKELSREQRFSVEKAYFQKTEKKKTLSRVKAEILRESGLPPWQVARYLDLLHEGEKRLKKIDDPSPEQKEAILSGYFEYLAAPAPPEPLLHTLLAEKAGVTHQQVHKVLLAWRLARLREIQGQSGL